MEVAQRFAAAIAARDEAAARGCAREWRPDRDGPARLFKQLVGQPVTLEIASPPRSGSDGRVAQPVAITQNGKAVEELTLLGDGTAIAGVATSEAHVEGFLAGDVPAVVAWDELTPDPAAAAAATSLVKAAEAGNADSSELAQAMSSAPGAIVAVGRLADAVGRGARIEVDEARGLPRSGRAVVAARFVLAGSEPEQIYLYVDHGDGTMRWRAWTPHFSVATLLAR